MGHGKPSRMRSWRTARRQPKRRSKTSLRVVRPAKPIQPIEPGSFRGAEQAQKDLRRDERVTAGGMAIVRLDAECFAERVETEAGGHWATPKGGGVCQMERQVHC